MNALLDTHVLLWWLFEPQRLSDRTRSILGDATNRLFWSAASTWECALKTAAGKLTLPEPPSGFFPHVLEEEGLIALSINHSHAALVADLPPHHRDPFDRLLVAQAKLERLSIVSVDPAIALYDVDVVW